MKRRERKIQKKWTSDQTKILIEGIKCGEAIWNCTAQIYKNREEKAKSWKEISAATEHSVEDCKNKWNSLKSRYNYERNKEVQTKSGQSGSEFNSKFEHFKSLNFLTKVESRLPEGIETNFPLIESEKESPQSEEVEIIVSPPKKKRKENESSVREEALKEITDFLRRQRNTKESSKWKRAFSDLVFHELERFKERDAQNLKRKLMIEILNFIPEDETNDEK